MDYRPGTILNNRLTDATATPFETDAREHPEFSRSAASVGGLIVADFALCDREFVCSAVLPYAVRTTCKNIARDARHFFSSLQKGGVSRFFWFSSRAINSMRKGRFDVTRTKQLTRSRDARSHGALLHLRQRLQDGELEFEPGRLTAASSSTSSHTLLSQA